MPRPFARELDSSTPIPSGPKTERSSVSSSVHVRSSHILTMKNAEAEWSIQEEGLELLSPPDDGDEWFDGEIDGLEDAFHETLKNEALAALKKPNEYTETHYDEMARLPRRWHESQKPTPHFWSERLWNWVADGEIRVSCYFVSLLTTLHLAGNSFWHTPMDLLYQVLVQNPPYTRLEQFSQDVNALMNIVADKPQWDNIQEITQQLWMGEMTWREFVDDMMANHLQQLRDASDKTSEKTGMRRL